MFTVAAAGTTLEKIFVLLIVLLCHKTKIDGKKLITLCTSGGSGLGRSGSDLAKFAKGADFKGGKDFTRGSGADVKKYIEGLLK